VRECDVVEEITTFSSKTPSGRKRGRARYSAHFTLLYPACCSLLAARCSLLAVYCSLLTTHYSLLTTHYSLLTAHCSLLTVHRSTLHTAPPAAYRLHLSPATVMSCRTRCKTPPDHHTSLRRVLPAAAPPLPPRPSRGGPACSTHRTCVKSKRGLPHRRQADTRPASTHMRQAARDTPYHIAPGCLGRESTEMQRVLGRPRTSRRTRTRGRPRAARR
jgi:hypothetical protein